MEPVRIMEPPSFNNGRAFCTVNSVPFTLILNILSKRSSVTLPSGANSPTPAFAKIISIRPFAPTVKVGQFGNVSLNATNVVANFLHRLIEFLLAAPRDENVGAFFDEEPSRGEPDPRSTAGDNRHFSLQFAHNHYSRT